MSKFFLILFSLFVSLNGASISSVANYDEAIRMAKSQNKKVMVFFHSEYCGWCDKMKKTTLKNPEVIEFINKKYIFVSIDRDKDAYPQKLTPRFVPTTYTIDPKTGAEIDVILGYKNANDFIYGLSED